MDWSLPHTGEIQYAGQAWVPEIGVYSYKARPYSPTLGRFLQTDPTGCGPRPNLYQDVGNDPINGSDPTGLDFCSDGSIPVFIGRLVPMARLRPPRRLTVSFSSR